MRRSRLLFQIAVPMVGLVVASLVVVTWLAARLFHEVHLQGTAIELAAGSALLEEVVAESLQGDHARIEPLAKRLGENTGLRITVVAVDGDVLGESDRDASLLDNHRTRPEIIAALDAGTGVAVRYSDTVEADMMYSARAVYRGGKLVGVVRVGMALADLRAAEMNLLGKSALIAGLAAILLTGCGLLLARRITRPLEELERLAVSYTNGELGTDMPTEGSVEVQRVAEAMRRMATELEARIATLVAERNEQEAVLSAMVEGVLAVDVRERVMALNATGARLLEVDARHAIGRTIQEVARNVDLQRFVAAALQAEAPLERDVVLLGEEPRFLQAHGAPVQDHAGRRIGAVVVLNDITRLRRLETVRRDFVANVSHELKTPVTSIKGFLETLLAGAMDDPANARRFLEIAARQADRLGAIIDDLLMLSRIEQESGQLGVERISTPLFPLVSGAMDVCRHKADQKGVRLQSRCAGDLEARINGALVEQALVNLIDNAIKYSEPDTVVEVEATLEEGAVLLRVRDHGSGIEAEHLPRLFERFYRVDRARSRALGGTGLGLAIVKHIAQVQGGSIEVDSKPGEGSTFTLRFPVS